MPVSEADFHMMSTLEALVKDPWPVANDKRALRCTGVALSVAVGILEVSYLSHHPNMPLMQIIDRFPQYWGSYHALLWWAMHGGPWHGSEQRTSRAYPLTP